MTFFFILVLYFIITVDNPINFWGVSMDGPTFSLGHALNLLHFFDGRVVGNPEVVQPGVWYQIICFIILFFSAIFHNGDIFEEVLKDPEFFWIFLQASPILITLVSYYLFNKLFFKNINSSMFNVSKSSNLGILTSISCFSLLLLNKNFYRYNIWELFNETFSFLVILIYYYFFKLYLEKNNKTVKSTEANHLQYTFFLGMAGCFIYFQKLPYLAFPFATGLFIFIINYSSGISKKEWLIKSLKDSIYHVIGFFTFLLIIGLLFFGVAGLKEMLGTHLTMLLRDGYYRGGGNNIIDPNIFISGLLSFWNDYKTFWIFLMSIISSVIAIYILSLRFKKITIYKDFLFQHASENFNFIKLSYLILVTILLIIGISKHYIPYYTLTVTAVFPLIFMEISKIRGFFIVNLILLPILVFIGFENAFLQREIRKIESNNAIESQLDEKEILSYGIPENTYNVWFYRTTTATGYRMTIIQFSSLYHMQDKFLKINGPNIEGSPWNEKVYFEGGGKLLKNIPYNFIIMDKRTRDYIKKVKIHEWLFDKSSFKETNLRRLVYFSKIKK